MATKTRTYSVISATIPCNQPEHHLGNSKPAERPNIINKPANKSEVSNRNIAPWIKWTEKRLQDPQNSVLKATGGLIKLSESILKAKKQNYVVSTEEI